MFPARTKPASRRFPHPVAFDETWTQLLRQRGLAAREPTPAVPSSGFVVRFLGKRRPSWTASELNDYYAFALGREGSPVFSFVALGLAS